MSIICAVIENDTYFENDTYYLLHQLPDCC